MMENLNRMSLVESNYDGRSVVLNKCFTVEEALYVERKMPTAMQLRYMTKNVHS